MKVAFVSYDFGEYCIRLAGAMAQDARVMLLLPRQLAAPHSALLNPAVDFRPFHKPRYRQVAEQIRTVSWLIRQIEGFDPDVVHLQQGHPWFNLALARLRHRPLVVTAHDPRRHMGDHEGRKVPQFLYDHGFRRASQLIVHGSPLKDVLVDELRIPEERVHVIPHIVLGSAPDRAGEEAPVILFFGRIWEYKGLDYLIRAEPMITKEVPDARIVIAGTGEDFGRYRAMMVHPERFEVHNEFVSDGDRDDLFSRASVVVLPYVDASQSGVIPLAYTFSKPVVATTVGALPEAVEHGRTGYLVPPRDESALAEAVIRLLKDRELRLSMGAAGKRKIDTEASPETVARETLAVYRQAMASGPAGPARRAGTGGMFAAATRLHGHIVREHWQRNRLVGPDPGIRFNYRVGRFLKSYLPVLSRNDDLYYLQGQGYWVLGNWRLWQSTGEDRYREIAVAASDSMLAEQSAEGAWGYPNPEWAGRVATAEGTWGSLGLLESYRHTGESRFLDGALRWHAYVQEAIGFQRVGDELAVNYFAHQPRGPRVPNNSAFLLRFLAELAEVTGDERHLQPAAGLVRFMAAAQLDSGEFPYTVQGTSGRVGRTHFQCFQYNAFQCLDLMRYRDLTGDDSVLPLVRGVLAFLRGGLDASGRAHYQCDNHRTSVAYHTAVMAAAFKQAAAGGIDGYEGLSNRAYSHLLGLQRRDGSFGHSRGDYGFLSDRRSYPRYLAMILYHLLSGDRTISGIRGKETVALRAADR